MHYLLIIFLFLGVLSDNEETKKVAIKLAVFIAKHSTLRAVDHLTDLMTDLGLKTPSPLRLHRTKCSSIIKFVIGPSLLSSLVEAIGDDKYSLIVDESTDVSCMKFMAMCVRYFNKEKGRIITEFLGIISVEEASGKVLYDSLIEYFKSIGMKIENMIGIGTDGGSNLCGINKSGINNFYSITK